MNQPSFTVLQLTPDIRIVVFDTGARWAVITDARLRDAFIKTCHNLRLGTTEECLMHANWAGGLAMILGVNFVRRATDWDKYLEKYGLDRRRPMAGQECVHERASWIPVATRRPGVGMTNGVWDSVPVFVALASGRVTGAFFSYVGGDDFADGNPLLSTPVPVFTTDEGLPQRGVTHWYPAPFHPKDLNA